MFPLAIVLTASFGLFASDAEVRDEVVAFIVDRLPLQDDGADGLREALEGVASRAGAVGIVGLLLLVYTASALMGAVRNSLNAVWDSDEDRPPLRGKLVDVLLVFGLGTLFALSLGIGLLGGVASTVADDLGVPNAVLDGGFAFVGKLLPIALAASVFTVALVALPAGGRALRDVWPGICVATLGYVLVQAGFSFYLENFSRYSAIYGSLGAVVAFMVFVYLAAMAFLLGAQYAAHWPRARAGELEGDGEPSDPVFQQVLDALRGLVVRRSRTEDKPNRRDRRDPPTTDPS